MPLPMLTPALLAVLVSGMYRDGVVYLRKCSLPSNVAGRTKSVEDKDERNKKKETLFLLCIHFEKWKCLVL